MVKVKEEPGVDQLQLRYRGDSPEADNNVECYQVGSISDQIRTIWGEEEVEVKPKAEQIGIDPNRQVVIKLDRDFLRKNYRAKWIEHVSSTYRHDAFKKACQVCRMKIFFDSPAKLIEHYREFHQKEAILYNCSLCYYSHRKQKCIVRHWERFHKHGKKHQSRRKPLSIEKHTISRTKNEPKNIWTGDDELVHSTFFNRPFECDICLKTFICKSNMRDHKIMHHSKEDEIQLYKCDECGKMCRTKNLFRLHKNIHKLIKFACVFCSKQFTSQFYLRKHELIHRNEMLTCEFCDAKFINENCQHAHYRKFHFGLLREQDKATGGLNKWFQGPRSCECYRCKYSLPISSIQQLRRHMIETCKLEGNNPINCKEKNCLRRFDTVELMNAHHKFVHNRMNFSAKKRTYECYICRYTKKGFSWVLLKEHLTKEHPEEIKCDICNKTFRLWCRFKQHKLIHGKRKFKCKYCPKRFRQKKGANMHERTHTKPVKCERCDFRCVRKKYLEAHIKNHCTGKKMKKNLK